MKQYNPLYIKEFDNICLILFFINIILGNISLLLIKLQIFNIPKKYTDAFEIFSLMFPFFVSVIVFIVKKSFPKSSSNKCFSHIPQEVAQPNFVGIINRNTVNYEQKCILNRTSHIDNIYNLIINDFNKRCLFITGESGAGKSTLLYFLTKKFKTNNIDFEIIYENYNNLKFNNNGEKKIFCLDQFEQALKYKDYINIIKQASKNTNNYFIFIFPQEFLTEISSVLHFLKYNIYTLFIDENDFMQLKEKVKLFCDLEDQDFNRYYSGENNLNNKNAKVLCNVLKQVNENKLPLVEFELLGKILENDLNETIPITDLEAPNALKVYLDSWIEKFPHPEIAYIILYLLSDNNIYDINDLMLVTFADRESFDLNGACSVDGLNILDAILNNLVIDVIIKNGKNYFKVKHGYIASQIRKYCSKKDFNPDILKNVDYYRNQKEYTAESEYVDEITTRYKRYTSKQSKIYLWILTATLYIGILIVNIFHINDPSPQIHIIYILTSLVSIPAIYYIYNYCIRILRIFQFKRYVCTSIIGIIMIILSYLFYQGWGIFMGIEIITLTLNIYFVLQRKTCYIAKKKYTKDSIVFFVLGFAITCLGILFALICKTILYSELLLGWTSIYLWLILSYYIQFIIYAVLSVFSHINYQYVLLHIGYANMIDLENRQCN